MNDAMSTFSGNLILLGAILLLIIFSFPNLIKHRRTVRPITAMTKMKKALATAVEAGKRIHISMGNAPLTEKNSAASYVALNTMKKSVRMATLGDRPLIATSGDGPLSLLTRNGLESAYRERNASDLYEISQGRLTGLTRFSYLAGTISVISNEKVYANLLLGDLGPETLLMSQAVRRSNGQLLPASSSIPAQAVFYAESEDTLIGEDVFAVAGYLQEDRNQHAGLWVQDILRWVLIGVMLVGGIMKIAQLVMGG
ncbi:MAG: hypothetical protein JEZ00_08485 [Anaerolineaceae bacterium]|nr:hypothetical protein [Anaerolineaceae bacterium]